MGDTADNSALSAPSRLSLGIGFLLFFLYVSLLVVAVQRWELPGLTALAGGFLLAALASEFLAKVVFAELFRLGSHRVGHPVSRAGAVKAALTGSAVARLVPAGGTLTPTTMAWAVKSEEKEMAGVALRVTLLTYGGLLTLTGVGLAWTAATTAGSALFPGEMIVALVLLAVGAGVLGGSPWLGSIVDRLPRFLRRHFSATADDGPLLVRELGLVIARIAAEAGVLWGSLHAFDLDLSFGQTVVAYGVSALIGGIPSLPGGLVLVEGGLIGILAAYGFGAGSVVAPVLIYRILDYWLPAGVGLATWLAIARSR